MAKAEAYYAMSSTITRLTGIPYRTNDMMMSRATGRILIRTQAVKHLELDADSFMLLLPPSAEGLRIEVYEDRKHVMAQHVRGVSGQQNMQFYARDMVRRWCQFLHKDQLRLSIGEVQKRDDGVKIVEMLIAKDICEDYNFKSRSKNTK